MNIIYFVLDGGVFTLDSDLALKTTIESCIKNGARQVDEHEYNRKVRELRKKRRRGLEDNNSRQTDFTSKGGYGRKCY